MKRQYPGRGVGGGVGRPPPQHHQPPMPMGRYGNNGGGMNNNMRPPNNTFNMRQHQHQPPFSQPPQGPPPRGGSFRGGDGGGRGFRGGGNAGPGHRRPPPPPPPHLQFQQQTRPFQQQQQQQQQQQRQQPLPPPPPPPTNGQQQHHHQQPFNHSGRGNYGGPPGPQFGNGRGRGGRNIGRGGPGPGRGRTGMVDGRGSVGPRHQQNPRNSQPWQQGPRPLQMQQQPPNGPFPPPSFPGLGAPPRRMPPPPPPPPPQQQPYQPQPHTQPVPPQTIQQFQQTPQLATQNAVNGGPQFRQHQLPHHRPAPVQTPAIQIMQQYQSPVTNVNSHPISGSTFPQNLTHSIAINSGSIANPSTSSMANSSTFNYPPSATANAPVTTIPAAQTATTQSKSGNSAVGATPTIQQIDDAWEEHTAPSGVSYYYNSILKESTFTMPGALKKKEMTRAPGVQSQQLSQSPSASVKPVWREYEDSKTGMKYYSDGVTTSWEKPEGFNADESDLGSSSLDDKKDAISIQSQYETSRSQEPSKKKQKTDNQPRKENFKNISDALDAFKKLLKSKNVSPILKWNEVVRLCQKTSTWVGCEDLLSVGERKQALSEYQTSRANELRNEQREQVNRAKEAFHTFLMEVAPTIRGFSARTSRFEDVRDTLSMDDRFDAVKDEATRESLFLDFCDEQQKREERQKRSRKKEAQDAFISFLQEKEEKGILSYASTWGSFLASLTETDKSDTRFSTSVSLMDSDRQVFFADHVIELQKIEDDKRRRIREARRNAERAQRASYSGLLHQLSVDGKIFPYSRWRGEVQELVSKESAFAPLYAQDRNAPRALFEAFVEEWYETYQRERSLMRRRLESLLKDRSLDVSSLITTETTYTSFKDLLTDERNASFSDQKETWEIINGQNPVSSALIFYKDLLSRAKTGTRPSISKPISRRSFRQDADESSEDEGEIIEDADGNTQAQAATNPSAAAEHTGENTKLDETQAENSIVEIPEPVCSKPEMIEEQKDTEDTVQESIANNSKTGSVEASARTINKQLEAPTCDVEGMAGRNLDNRPVLLDKDDDAVITYGLLQTAEPYFENCVKTCLHTSSRESTKGIDFCCELRSQASSVQHIKNSSTYDCGFRNLQMMLSALLPNLQANHNIFKYIPLRRPVPVVPTVTQLESSLEEAWAEGFDPKGAEHYCHKILDRQSWIGTMEVASLLWYFGVDATVVQFINCQESRNMLPKFVKAYFCKALDRGGCPFNSNCVGSNPHAKALLDVVTVHDNIIVEESCSCHLLPLYLQWEGHSVTVVGIEEDGTFLVYDPSKNGQRIQHDLTRNRSVSPLRLNSVAKVSTKDLSAKDTQIILCTLLSVPDDKRRKIPAVITAANDAVVKES